MKCVKRILLILLVILLIPCLYLFILWVPTSVYHDTREAAIRYNERAFGFLVPPAYEYNGTQADIAEINLDGRNALYVFLDEEDMLVFGQLKQKRGRFKLDILLVMDEAAQQNTHPKNTVDINGIPYLFTFSETVPESQDAYRIDAWNSFLRVAASPNN